MERREEYKKSSIFRSKLWTLTLNRPYNARFHYFKSLLFQVTFRHFPTMCNLNCYRNNNIKVHALFFL